jgi:serine protease
MAMSFARVATACWIVWAAFAGDLLAQSREYQPDLRRTIAPESPAFGFIVKYRAASAAANKAGSSEDAERSIELAKRLRAKLKSRSAIAPDVEALEFDMPRERSAQLALLAAIERDPAVETAALDEWRHVQATPNDPLYVNQWYLQAAQPAAANFESAWDITTGDAGVVVAVLDTGIRFDHPDLGRADSGGQLLAGYDFVSSEADGGARVANDGDGRDTDATDPGDWIAQSDKSEAVFANCTTSNSSWHGTRVSGMIAALTNNSSGIAGGTWGARVLPVRVLGKCGGRDSDILAGMRWAAGLSVPGIPNNETPARILNLSLGSRGACSAAYPPVLDELRQQGVLVVSSAGNEGGPVSAPANCNGVVAVAALRHVGTKVGFSNLGPEVVIGAPGGNCVNVGAGQPCLFSLDTTSNAGITSPANNIVTDQFNSNLGTSFAAPIVSAVAALMYSTNRHLDADLLGRRIREGAKAYLPASDPSIPACRVPAGPGDTQTAECVCNTSACGAGMINALGSVNAARRPVAAIALPAAISSGQDVSFLASGSVAACGRTISGFAWTVVSSDGPPPAIVGAATDTATIVAPSAGAVVLQVTVTDDQGLQDSAQVLVAANTTSTTARADARIGTCPSAAQPPAPAPTPTPAPQPAPTPPPAQQAPPSSGGGGGTLDWLLLGLLAARAAQRFKAARASLS